MIRVLDGSASYEAVNWKVIKSGTTNQIYWVSLVWGCELKDCPALLQQVQLLVSLVWGCELKELDSVADI